MLGCWSNKKNTSSRPPLCLGHVASHLPFLFAHLLTDKFALNKRKTLPISVLWAAKLILSKTSTCSVSVKRKYTCSSQIECTKLGHLLLTATTAIGSIHSRSSVEPLTQRDATRAKFIAASPTLRRGVPSNQVVAHLISNCRLSVPQKSVRGYSLL